MKKQLSETELDNQYRNRATLLAKLIGKYFGSGNRKRAQRVFREPSRWAKWTVSVAPIIPDTYKRKMVLFSPIQWLYLLITVGFVRYFDKRKKTLEAAERAYRASAKAYLEKKEGLLNQLVDTEAIKKYEPRIARDSAYSGDDPSILPQRAKTTLVTCLMGTPQDPDYPQISVKIANRPRWQRWFGLKPDDSPWVVLRKVFVWGITSTTAQKRELLSYFTARNIAKQEGYNAGRLRRSTVNQLVDAGIVHKASTDENGNVDTETIEDPHSLDDIDRIEIETEDSDTIRETVLALFAAKGINYNDLLPREWSVIFERSDVILNGYEFSSKNGVSISSFYGDTAHAKEQKWSRVKQKVRTLATNREGQNFMLR